MVDKNANMTGVFVDGGHVTQLYHGIRIRIRHGFWIKNPKLIHGESMEYREDKPYIMGYPLVTQMAIFWMAHRNR